MVCNDTRVLRGRTGGYCWLSDASLALESTQCGTPLANPSLCRMQRPGLGDTTDTDPTGRVVVEIDPDYRPRWMGQGECLVPIGQRDSGNESHRYSSGTGLASVKSYLRVKKR